ncbi:MarP family serine protease [Salinibacterium sp. UTAS2018]|uniref:MarP family serine protease n=1 Tax=unclassified Salinibacterium TaxID=2632331 RepID=UPI0010096A9A|nr:MULTISPECIES: MarP family serine protease [unclassified Salinibacterium]MBH0010382.1 MarP family serine protease [Salinibacterium sp. SWN1162]QAV69036.1 MarP family serine protease [Salinibacterium sp. UTAS2018]
MNIAPLLDLILVVVLVGYAIYGLRIGLTRSIFVIAGVAVGIFFAALFARSVAEIASNPQARVLIAVSVAVALVALGHALGSAAGRAIHVAIETRALRGADRAVGGLAIAMLAALVISTVSFSAAQLGIPILSRTIAASSVIRTIQDATPDVVEANIARWRTALSDRALPLLGSPLGDPNAQIPSIDTESPALDAAAQSVVRITGNAYACGQGQTGSGFVVAPERVMTNAHVVSGTSGPVVEAMNGQVLGTTIVYFDSVNDLAILAVPGLTVDALRLGDTARPGTSTAIQGYPYGGPFTTNPALVQQVSTFESPDIYGDGGAPREVYTLAGQVNPGNSGGPLLTLDGDIAGTIFGSSTEQNNVGYALTLDAVRPVAQNAADLSTTVSSGVCIAH